MTKKTRWEDWFPSPYGDFVFQLRISGRASTVIRRCFRPLTGILFFNFAAALDDLLKSTD